jgi:hypothetical protein
MAKSISQTYGSKTSSGEKMPNILTITDKNLENITFRINGQGELIDNLTSVGVPLMQKNSDSDREKVELSGDMLKNFYLMTLDENPGLNWVIGIVDLKESVKHQGEGKYGDIYKAKDVDQCFLSELAKEEGFNDARYFTDHLKDYYGTTKKPNGFNFVYDSMGTFQMLALLYKGKDGFKFMGIVLHQLTASRSMFAGKKENEKMSFLGFEQNIAYCLGAAAKKVNPQAKNSMNYYVAPTIAEEVPSDILKEAEVVWDETFDRYERWQEGNVARLRKFCKEEREKNNSSKTPKKINESQKEEETDDDDDSVW